jgi:hypothetical protein
VGPKVLFNDQHIFEFVESQKAKLKKAYEALSDDKATDETFTQEWKRQFMLDVPSLKPDKWEAEERPTETVVYVPFVGDPSVFKLSPSAFNGTVAVGEIVDHDLLITVSSPFPNFDVVAYVKREIVKVEWRLNNLRGSTEHLNQQLEIGLRESMAARKRIIENKAKARQSLNIPRRAPAPAPAPKVEPLIVSKAAVREKPVQKSWDIFMSHASSDKPYVRLLVAELRNADISVWFDEDSVTWGEALRPAINKGLVNSRYAIVVLSKSFLAERKWTDHELNGLFAREKVGNFIILPIWHGIGHEDILQYDPALADRLAKVSDTDGYPDIVKSALKVLGQSAPESSVGEMAHPPSLPASGVTDDRELVAYAWYEQKGPGAERAQIYIRKSNFIRGGYVLIDGDQEHDGTEDDVSGRFFMAHKYLKAKGFERMQYSNPSNNPAFEI